MKINEIHPDRSNNMAFGNLMKSKEKVMETYEAPKVEVIEVEVEQGFAVSGEGQLYDFGNGGNL